METSIVAHLLLHICQQGNRSYEYVATVFQLIGCYGRVGACPPFKTFLVVVHSLFFID